MFSCPEKIVCVELIKTVWIAANPTEIIKEKDAEDDVEQATVLNKLVL